MRSILRFLPSMTFLAAIAAGMLVPLAARADGGATPEPDSSRSAADGRGPHGLEGAVRIGYALPMGQVNGSGSNPALSNVYAGMVPITLDLGVRPFPNFFFGGHFQYAVALAGDLATSPGGGATCAGGASCSGSVLAGGLDMHYHFRPAAKLDPWVGLGVGYEVASFSASQGNATASFQFSGIQLMNLQVGADYKTATNVGFGPYAGVTVGEYTGCGFSDTAAPFAQKAFAADLATCNVTNPTLHEWVSFGVRGVFDTSP